MENQLRKAIEDVKYNYIQKLIDAGILDASNKNDCSLTLSELKIMLEKVKYK